MDLGETIKALRTRSGLSQQAFAASLGISLRGYSNYEHGRRPGLKQLYLFMEAAMTDGHYDLFDVFNAYLHEVLPGGVESLVEVFKDVRTSDLRTRIVPTNNGFEAEAIQIVKEVVRGQRPNGDAIIDAIAVLIPDMQRAAWFREEWKMRQRAIQAGDSREKQKTGGRKEQSE